MMEYEIDGSAVLSARRRPDDGLEAWALVQQRGYEGSIAKGPMAPCGRATRWWKVKVRHEGRFPIGGVVVTQTAITGLVVGARVGRELRYVEIVEWRVGRGTVDALMRLDTRRVDPPFADFRRRNSVL